ncbi:MAG: hypothetical protein L0Y58_26195 [Verrucomicrobia subdivision 3 bacterium]|nr:hypothetical protein [Limisphaerales bacterium]
MAQIAQQIKALKIAAPGLLNLFMSIVPRFSDDQNTGSKTHRWGGKSENILRMQQVWPDTMVTENNLAQSISALKRRMLQQAESLRSDDGHFAAGVAAFRHLPFPRWSRNLLSAATSLAKALVATRR